MTSRSLPLIAGVSALLVWVASAFGQTILISPGHGYFNNNGTWQTQRSFYYGVVEDFLTPEFAIILRSKLQARGYTVFTARNLSKTAGNGISGFPKWQECARAHMEASGFSSSIWNVPGFNYRDQDIICRPNYANSLGVDLMVSLHTNGGGGTGTETYYDSTSGSPTNSQSAASKVHSRVISAIRSDYLGSWTDRGLKNSNGAFGEIRRANVPSILIEVAFHDTQSPDNSALQNSTFRNTVATAIADGIDEYFGNSGGGQPDLTVIEPVTTSATIVAAGGTIQVGWTEKNEGAAASAPKHHTKISLSTAQYGTTHQIGYYFMNTLGQDNSQGYYDNIVIPTSIPPGDYYLTAFIDCDAEVAESDENNNIGTSNPTKITVTGGNYTITTSSSPANGGTTTGGGTYPAGTSRTVSATANSGFTFVNWTENGNIISSSSSFNITLNRNWNLVANFSASSYTITTSSSPANGGITNGGGTYPGGSSRTVTANANSGYTFVNWTENGNVVSSSSSYTFTLNGNRNLVANFSTVNFTISTSSSPSGGGTTSGGGSYAAGSTRTVTASANSGFSFNNWTENGLVVSSSSSYTFTLNSNRSLAANFAANTVNYTISTSSSPSNGGTTSGGGTFAAGSSRTVTATANSGYTFSNWTESGNVVSTSASYNFTLNNSRTLVANFTANQSTGLPTVVTNAATSPTSTSAVINGTVTSSGDSPIINYYFFYWSDPNSPIGIDRSRISISGNNFSAILTGLVPNTPYYFRAYAQNSSTADIDWGVGWNAGAVVSFSTLASTSTGLVANVSTRLPVGMGDDALIEGFIVQGPAGSTKRIMIRALGPTLGAFGIGDPLPDPTLDIFDGNNVKVATNDDWTNTQLGGLIAGDQSAEIAASGLGPGNELESAIIANLTPGNFTAVVRGWGNTVGSGLVDAYDLSAASSAKVVNFSTRGLIQPGDKLLIAGFIVQNGPVRAAIRAIGPSLVAFNITNALPDTTLQLRDQNGMIVRENDDWETDQEQELLATGLQPTNAKEAALISTIPPGQYTAQVRGKPETTGIGAVEVYFLQ
jgi:N-acetylmuramoyl-L-alanine amidase